MRRFMSTTLKIIKSSKAVAIIRVKDPIHIIRIADCLVEAGVQALEITSNTPGYLDGIRKVKEKYPRIHVGAGTITHPALAQEALAAGAEFLVTPNTSQPVIDAAKRAGVPILVGAFTPTEIYQAHDWGADLVKVFPSGAVSPDYIASLTYGPYNDIPLVAVGSVDENNASTWMEAGCVGVGFGGNLTQPIENESDYGQRLARVKALLTSIQSATQC